MNNATETPDAKMEAIASEVREFILNDLGREGIANLSSDEDLFESGVLDSMGIVEIISFCEQKYAITFDLSSIGEDTFSSLNKLARSIVGYMAPAA